MKKSEIMMIAMSYVVYPLLVILTQLVWPDNFNNNPNLDEDIKIPIMMGWLTAPLGCFVCCLLIVLGLLIRVVQWLSPIADYLVV